MTVISFQVPVVPVGQPRQRHVALAKGVSRNYIPKDHPIHAFKATVVLFAKQVYLGLPLLGPVHIMVTFVFPRPKAKIWKTKAMPRYEHTSVPDIDNCLKAVLDALNGVTWKDDSQVCSGMISKVVAAGDEQPHVDILIRTLP